MMIRTSSEILLWLRDKCPAAAYSEWSPEPNIGDIWYSSGLRCKIVETNPLTLTNAHGRPTPRPNITLEPPAKCLKSVLSHAPRDLRILDPSVVRLTLMRATHRAQAPFGARKYADSLGPLAPLKGDVWRNHEGPWRIFLVNGDEFRLRQKSREITVPRQALLNEFFFVRGPWARNKEKIK